MKVDLISFTERRNERQIENGGAEFMVLMSLRAM